MENYSLAFLYALLTLTSISLVGVLVYAVGENWIGQDFPLFETDPVDEDPETFTWDKKDQP